MFKVTKQKIVHICYTMFSLWIEWQSIIHPVVLSAGFVHWCYEIISYWKSNSHKKDYKTNILWILLVVKCEEKEEENIVCPVPVVLSLCSAVFQWKTRSAVFEPCNLIRDRKIARLQRKAAVLTLLYTGERQNTGRERSHCQVCIQIKETI